MTFSELKRKDVVCIGDGRVLGRVSDLEMDPANGKIISLIVSGAACCLQLLHSDKNQLVVPWGQIACIGDDVILIAPSRC